jgi:hypothetical protein
MDPHSGKLYPSLAAAQAAGVPAPVEVSGSPEAIAQLSRAAAHYGSLSDRAKRRAANKVARRSRRRNR